MSRGARDLLRIGLVLRATNAPWLVQVSGVLGNLIGPGPHTPG